MSTEARTSQTRCALMLALLLNSSNAISGGVIIYEVGTEDVGLAAAGYAARAQDATTVFTNPAGMTRLEGQQLEVGTQILYSNMKFSIGSGTDTRPSPLGLGADDGGTATGYSGWFPGGGFFYSYSVSPDLKIGFASTGSFGASLKYDDNWVGRYYGQQVTMIGASLLPSIAYRVNEQLSVGLSVNAMYGYLKNVVAVNNIAPGAADGKLKLTDTRWGWGANLGLMYEANPGTRFGLTYSSQVKLDFSAPAQFSGIAPGLNALLAARGLLNAQTNLGITVPQQVMGSFFYTLNDRWSMMGNAGWQQWSKFGQVEVSIDSSDPTGVTTNLQFKDTWHGALGTQYRMSEPWRLNFGVAYDSNMQANPVLSPLLPVNAAWRFGAGAQNQVSKSFSWGLAGEYLYGGSMDLNKTGSVPVAIGGRGNLQGTYSNVGTFFMAANFNWKF